MVVRAFPVFRGDGERGGIPGEKGPGKTTAEKPRLSERMDAITKGGK
jgi:hypothetical protein